MKPLIQIIGSIHLDFVTTAPRCPSAGETIRATRFDINAGGKGANQAAACGRAAFLAHDEQDVDVEMIGAVGKDDPYYASLLQPAFKKSGVNTTHISEVPGTTTGSATIIVDEGAGGENRILFVPGAGFKGMDSVEEVLGRSTSSGRIPNVVILQGEIPRQTVLSIVEHYNSSEQTAVVLNPAPVWPEGIPGQTLKNLAALIVNETECLLLVKAMSSEGYTMKAVEKEEDLTEEVLREIAKAFHSQLNIHMVIITLGAKGVLYSQHPGKQNFLSAKKVDKVVDTTAAGDTFVGYFAAELARASVKGKGGHEFSIERACNKANAAAAICVSRPGAMQSIPFGYEL